MTGTVVTPALPPGPRLPPILLTPLFIAGRQFLSPVWRRRYGETFSVRLAQRRDVVVVTNPEHIRQVFATAPALAHAGEGNMILAPVMGRTSVLVLDEDEHQRSRKQLMPAFNGAALRGYSAMMTELAESTVDRWPTGREFAVHPSMNEVTLEIILRVVFGLSDGERLARLRPHLRQVAAIGTLQLVGWAAPRLLRYPPWRNQLVNLRATDELLYAEIAERRGVADLARRTDVLSRLLAADPDTPDVVLRDHLMTLLLAGHETTATALAWSLHELARDRQVLRTAQQAADRGDEEYLQAVAKEAMRLHPVIYSVARRLTEDTMIGGTALPAGVIVAPGIGLVHSDPAVHPSPDRFNPQRFVGHQPEAGTWIPFGGGVRRCLGAGFSLQEATAVLRAVLTRYDLTTTRRPERPKARNITLVPAHGARLVATRRG